MSYLPSRAISLLVRSDKLVVGLTFPLCLSELTDFSASISDRMVFNSFEISSSLLSNRLSIDASETNRTTKHVITHAITTKYTKKRNRSNVKLFNGFRSLLNSCSILAKRIEASTSGTSDFVIQ